MATLYPLRACKNLMAEYFEKGGCCETVEEGVLGLGTIICYGDGLKTTIIKEIYLNEWSSGHTIRMYNKMPKKYRKMLNATVHKADGSTGKSGAVKLHRKIKSIRVLKKERKN